MDTEAGDILLVELFSAVFLRFDGCEDVFTPPRKTRLFGVFARSEGKRFLRNDVRGERGCLDWGVTDEGGSFNWSDGSLSKFLDDLDDFGAVLVNPWSSLKDVGWSGGVCDGVHVFVVNIPFSEGKFNGMSDGKCVGSMNGSKIDGCLELEAMGKVAGFNLFYES